MNSELNTGDPELTAEQLELATRRTLPPAAPLDPQTAALRERFLHLGRAVETAAANFDQAAMVARLTQRREDEISRARSPAQRTDRWMVLLATALAASALFAIVRIAMFWPEESVAITAPPALPAEAPVDPRAYKYAVISGGTVEYAPWNAPWSDPLDEEIASAQAAVDQLSGRATGLDGSLEKFGSRLEALSAEIESGSL